MITPDLLCTHPLFQSLGKEDLNQIAGAAADLRLLAGEWLTQEGELPAFFVLLSGDLEVTKRVSGEEQVISYYHPGDYFGEVPLLLGSTVVASLRAMNDIRVLKLEADDFHQMRASSPEIAAEIAKTMSQRVSFLQQLSAKAPARTPLVIGSRIDLNCHSLRQFLLENQVNFRWIDPSDPAAVRQIPEEVEQGPYPVMAFPDGDALYCPTLRVVAERLGLQTVPRHRCYDVVVIGGGPAGLAAAVYGASEGLETLLIDREAPGGQAGSSSRIENYLGFPTGLSGAELASRALRQAKRFGAEILVARRVTGIECVGSIHHVELDGDEAVEAKTLILATGVSWRSMSIPGVEKLLHRGIYYGAARTEALNVRGKEIYLIGGGNSAGQSALFFSGFAHRVTLLIRGSSIEKGMSHYLIQQLQTKNNISVELNTRVVEAHGEDRLEAITVENDAEGTRKQYPTDSLFVLIGADAETDWLCEEVARDDRGYLLTGLETKETGKWPLPRDPFLLETSVPGIFAAGDVRHGSVKRVASGVGEGSMAIAFIHQYLALTAGES